MSNTYEYNVYREVYNEMMSGRKDIEIRLLNEKSEKIKKGDKIKFKVIDDNDYVLVEVTNKYIFENYDELWSNKDIVLRSSMNHTKEEIYNILCEIFGEERLVNSKIVGIQFKKI